MNEILRKIIFENVRWAPIEDCVEFTEKSSLRKIFEKFTVWGW